MADIPINDVTPRIQLVDAPGGTSIYPYPFPIFEESDLVVEHTVNATGVTTTLTLTTEYTVSGVGAETGGNVTLVTASAINDIITISRDTPVQRLNDFPTQGDFAAATLNKELDTMTMIMQQLERDIARTLRLSSTDTADELIIPDLDDRKGKYLFFDTVTGDPKAAQNLGTGTAVITPFMETVLDDADADAARATLEIAEGGALAYMNADFGGAASGDDIEWDTEDYDTDSIVDVGGANPERLTVPAGVTKVRLTGSIASTGATSLKLFKNGSALVVGGWSAGTASSSGNVLISPPITVVPGDYFTVQLTSGAGITIYGSGGAVRSWFAMEILQP